jgi:hypothetical protein
MLETSMLEVILGENSPLLFEFTEMLEVDWSILITTACSVV